MSITLKGFLNDFPLRSQHRHRRQFTPKEPKIWNFLWTFLFLCLTFIFWLFFFVLSFQGVPNLEKSGFGITVEVGQDEEWGKGRQGEEQELQERTNWRPQRIPAGTPPSPSHSQPFIPGEGYPSARRSKFTTIRLFLIFNPIIAHQGYGNKYLCDPHHQQQ